VHEECTVRRIESRARAKQGRRITRERKKGERETEGRGGGRGGEGKKRTTGHASLGQAGPRQSRRFQGEKPTRNPGAPADPTAIVVGVGFVCIGEPRTCTRVRASERVSEWRGRARGSERLRCARAIFRPRKRSAWVSAWIPRSFEAHAAPRRARHVNGQVACSRSR